MIVRRIVIIDYQQFFFRRPSLLIFGNVIVIVLVIIIVSSLSSLSAVVHEQQQQQQQQRFVIFPVVSGNKNHCRSSSMIQQRFAAVTQNHWWWGRATIITPKHRTTGSIISSQKIIISKSKSLSISSTTFSCPNHHYHGFVLSSSAFHIITTTTSKRRLQRNHRTGSSINYNNNNNNNRVMVSNNNNNHYPYYYSPYPKSYPSRLALTNRNDNIIPIRRSTVVSRSNEQDDGLSTTNVTVPITILQQQQSSSISLSSLSIQQQQQKPNDDDIIATITNNTTTGSSTRIDDTINRVLPVVTSSSSDDEFNTDTKNSTNNNNNNKRMKYDDEESCRERPNDTTESIIINNENNTIPDLNNNNTNTNNSSYYYYPSATNNNNNNWMNLITQSFSTSTSNDEQEGVIENITNTASTTNPSTKENNNNNENNNESTSQTTTTKLYESTIDTIKSTLQNTNYKVSRSIRKRTGILFSVSGFVVSSTKSIFFNNEQKGFIEQLQQSWIPLYQSLVSYLHNTGISNELQSIVNHRLLDNIIILSILQQQQQQQRQNNNNDNNNNNKSSQTTTKSTKTIESSSDGTDPIITKQDAIRLMKFATAAYGETMIRSAEIDTKGSFTMSSSSLTVLLGNTDNSTERMLKRVVEYCNLQSLSDIIHMDIDHTSSNTDILRHLIAIDDTNQQIIVSIRGTFTLSEFFVDVAAFSRPFCNGEAHAEMATMAERLLDAIETIILDQMTTYPNYEVIFVGHSLGAGTASLLNILFHHKHPEWSSKVRCVVFACPPVFYPNVQEEEATSSSNNNVEECPRNIIAMSRCINFIHEKDCVPFLSVDSVRHLCNCIKAIDTYRLRWIDRIRIITQYDEPDPELVDIIHRAHEQRLRPLPGAPQLIIPAQHNILLLEEDNQQQQQSSSLRSIPQTKYTMTVINDPTVLSNRGIILDLRMWDDHVPSQYEQALLHLHDKSSDVE